MKNWKPLFIENSSIPKILSYISPIEINAITLGPIVASRGEMSEATKRHETIHFQQFLELAFIGFIIIYYFDYLKNYLKYKDGKIAYIHIRAEIEAYENHHDENYLKTRKRYAWLKKTEYDKKITITV